MARKNQPQNAIQIGSVKISMLDKAEHKRFHLGLIQNCKQFFKDPANLAEFHKWQEQRKLKGVEPL
jgi:hypothetical protein